ncbi:MAG: hypothetical protein AB7F43_07860 [Bacteriovoracia bacterium]
MILRSFLIVFFGFVSLPSTCLATQEKIEHTETEVKYLISDLSRIPSDILEALETGSFHPNIKKRGFVLQEYLPISETKIEQIFDLLKEAKIPFGDQNEHADFLIPGMAKEIRLMSKSIKVGREEKIIYQLTIKAEGGISVEQLETPENIDEEQAAKLKAIFASFRKEVISVTRKAYFELIHTDRHGISRNVEVDMFIDKLGLQAGPVFINGEIEFHGDTQKQAIAAAEAWREDVSSHPVFFDLDLTGVPEAKTRSISTRGVPENIVRALAPAHDTNTRIFKKIALQFASWTEPEIENACTRVFDPPAMPLAKRVSFWSLIYHLARARDIHVLAERLQAAYDAVNFRIPVPFSQKSIFIFQDREHVAKVLKRPAKLPFVNKNFDDSHGHFQSINSVNTTDELWKDLHDGLAEIFKQKKIDAIMEKHKGILFRSDTFVINDVMEEYFLRVWAEYSFGIVDPNEFASLRLDLIETLQKSFHGNRLNRLPWIGSWTSKRNFNKLKKKFKQIDDGLARIVRSAIKQKQGAFYELYEKLAQKYDDAFEKTVDNSFLGVLVYDFIYIVLLDAMVNIAKYPELDRGKQVQKSMRDAFLYPFRFRTAEEDFDEVKNGDYCIINLQKSGLYFSAGQRFCPGAPLFREIYKKFLGFFSEYDIRLNDPMADIVYNGSRDVPIMTSRHLVRVTPKVAP